jgi:hypothetical protein
MKVLLILVADLVLLILGVAVVGAWLPKRHVVSRSASYRVTPEQTFFADCRDAKLAPRCHEMGNHLSRRRSLIDARNHA